MGWSSWNQFGIGITEGIVRETADALVSSGMARAGYTYVNIDDGWFGGRDENWGLICHPEKFPSGMRALTDYIHSKGLKAGIYTDAGSNTCGAFHNGDALGIGVGLHGHEEEDLRRMLIDWNFDYIKVDWCGGKDLGLDDREVYSRIGRIIRELRPDVVYNVCRWQFPGAWIVDAADSWRISADLRDDYVSVLGTIDTNADLWLYSGPGHVNDMDMLQVGRAMSYEEDMAHFTMWCMMASPLIAGNDLRQMSPETLSILTNRDLIALNQDPLVSQARRAIRNAMTEVWVKPMVRVGSGQVTVALMNRSAIKNKIRFKLDEVGIDASKGYAFRDLWTGEEKTSHGNEICIRVASRGVTALRIMGEPSVKKVS